MREFRKIIDLTSHFQHKKNVKILIKSQIPTQTRKYLLLWLGLFKRHRFLNLVLMIHADLRRTEKITIISKAL